MGILGKAIGSMGVIGAADLGGVFSDTPPENLGQLWENIKKNGSQSIYDAYQAGVPAVQAWKDFGSELGNEMRTWGSGQSIPGIPNAGAATLEIPQELTQGEVVQDPSTGMLTVGVRGGRETPTEMTQKAPGKPKAGSGSPKARKPLKQAPTASPEASQQDGFQQWLAQEYAAYQQQQQELAGQRQSIDQKYKVQQHGRSVNPWDNPFLQSY